MAAGVVLSFVSAVVPGYPPTYQLLFGVLVAGVTPYLVYGVVVVLLGDRLTAVAGGMLLVLHLLLVISERFLGGADYSDSYIYAAPLFLATLLTPLVVKALREPWSG